MTERGQNVYTRCKMLQDLYLLCKYITSVISATSVRNNTKKKNVKGKKNPSSVWDTGGCGTPKRRGHGHRGLEAVSLPSPPSLAGFIMIYPMQIWPFLRVTFIAFGKSSRGQHSGEELAWKPTAWAEERELELGIYQTDSPRALRAPLGCTQSRNSPPAPAESPAPACQQLLTLSPNRGAFLSFFSWYFVVWMLIPLTKLSPMLFPFSFPLISFSQWKREKKKEGKGEKKKRKYQPA